ncbi:unnamed protein product [Paramecium sonneborni]|uniref:Uncharacterized protein n=1 Tax=Paramecium sonneborni TaxID=65129 RepID=A0A8S1QR90_9CILI|nr:unnamed protein product [Paramecium sonneborni]
MPATPSVGTQHLMMSSFASISDSHQESTSKKTPLTGIVNSWTDKIKLTCQRIQIVHVESADPVTLITIGSDPRL